MIAGIVIFSLKDNRSELYKGVLALFRKWEYGRSCSGNVRSTDLSVMIRGR